MATAQFAQMGAIPHPLKSDLDMDTFFDFTQSTALNSPQTPAAPSSSRLGLTPHPTADAYSNNAPSPYDTTEERQIFAGPSHEYERFKQQTGFPVGPVANIPTINTVSDTFNPSQAFVGGGFNSGIDDMFDTGYNSWSTGLDIDADVNMDFGAPQPQQQQQQQQHPSMFYAPTVQSRSRSGSEFVDPSSINEEPPSNVGRLWPGMHQQQAQQAAMAKAQAQAQAHAQQQQQQRMHFEAQQQQHQQQQQHHQQQQMRLAAHQQQQQQQQQQEAKHNAAKSRASSYQTDVHTEESISRLLNQMRQNSAVPSMSGDDVDGGMLPHVSRMRKEEEEMDEDERLLASEEGKKLSSKERRQLRNKVSARAFRSRRKEYISQLEGEVAVKAQECNDLKTTNKSLADENSRYRNLIETLLRHPAYVPFIEDFGKDVAVGAPAHQLPASMAPTPAPAPTPSQDLLKHDERPAGRPMLETPVDLSLLNLNNANGFSVPSNAGVNFQQPRIYAVRDLPQGPSPLDLALSMNASQRKSDYSLFDSMSKAEMDSDEFHLYADNASPRGNDY